jgi:hypothetical protein
LERERERERRERERERENSMEEKGGPTCKNTIIPGNNIALYK